MAYLLSLKGPHEDDVTHRRSRLPLLAAALVVAASFRCSAQVTSDRILRAAAEPQNWLTYSGGYFQPALQPLTQITPANVKNLELEVGAAGPGVRRLAVERRSSSTASCT
jgi:glucose dehydrogenase